MLERKPDPHEGKPNPIMTVSLRVSLGQQQHTLPSFLVFTPTSTTTSLTLRTIISGLQCKPILQQLGVVSTFFMVRLEHPPSTPRVAATKASHAIVLPFKFLSLFTNVTKERCVELEGFGIKKVSNNQQKMTPFARL